MTFWGAAQGCPQLFDGALAWSNGGSTWFNALLRGSTRPSGVVNDVFGVRPRVARSCSTELFRGPAVVQRGSTLSCVVQRVLQAWEITLLGAAQGCPQLFDEALARSNGGSTWFNALLLG